MRTPSWQRLVLCTAARPSRVWNDGAGLARRAELGAERSRRRAIRFGTDADAPEASAFGTLTDRRCKAFALQFLRESLRIVAARKAAYLNCPTGGGPRVRGAGACRRFART